MARDRGKEKAVSRVITGHDEIKEWVESRGGHPAAVKLTYGKDEPGNIRIDFSSRARGKRREGKEEGGLKDYRGLFRTSSTVLRKTSLEKGFFRTALSGFR